MALSKLRSGLPLDRQTKEVISNAHDFCTIEKDNILRTCEPCGTYCLVHPTKVIQRVAQLTGVSERTVNRIVQEKKQGQVQSPKKTSTRSGVLNTIDDFDICAIRRIVHNMYISGENVKLEVLLAKVQEDLNLFISKSSLRKLLLQNGFRFRKINTRKILMEKPDVAVARARYLREVRKIRSRQPERSIIYLDETWYCQYDIEQRAWLDGNEINGRKNVIGKGKRLIIVHAGSDKGFVNDALLSIWTDGKSNDYHDSMNARLFEEWFTKMLKNISSNSVVVMNNASYHSRQMNKTPASSSTKGDIKTWLQQNDIDYDEEMLKVELLDLVRSSSHKKTYFVDELAKEHGHQVLRLSPYQCDLNSIELIWAQMKRSVRARNTNGTLAGVSSLVEEAVAGISASDWAKCCEHVIRLENEYWERERVADEVEPVVIPLASSDSEADSSDTD